MVSEKGLGCDDVDKGGKGDRGDTADRVTRFTGLCPVLGNPKLETCFLAFSHFREDFFSFYVPDKIQVLQKRKDFTTKCIKQNSLIGVTPLWLWLCMLKFSTCVCSFV